MDKQTYEIVQKIREGRRRPTPMGEMNVFSGMVYCADCGKKMYLCRCSKVGTLIEYQKPWRSWRT